LGIFLRAGARKHRRLGPVSVIGAAVIPKHALREMRGTYVNPAVPWDEALKRAAEIALELDVIIRLHADGSVEIAGRSAQLACTDVGVSDPAVTPTAATATLEVLTIAALGRALRAGELLTYQQVLYDIGVSRWTLWRAARSNLPGFPPPILIRKRQYWRRSDVALIEDALMFFKGRVAFDRERQKRR
jgi:hypothetical protein